MDGRDFNRDAVDLERSPMGASVLQRPDQVAAEAFLARYALKRAADASEIAEAIAFLISDEASATISPEVLKKNCADPKWKEDNLGLWYSVCRQPLRW